MKNLSMPMRDLQFSTNKRRQVLQPWAGIPAALGLLAIVLLFSLVWPTWSANAQSDGVQASLVSQAASPSGALAAMPSWSVTSELGQARQLHSSTLLPNGLVLVAGGNNGFDNVLKSAELYNPATGKWTATGEMSAARESHSATMLPNGKVLVAGGADESGALKSAELYDPATGQWSAGGEMTTVRFSHTATLLTNGLVLVAGGGNGSTQLKSAELFDPARGKWTATEGMIGDRLWHTATLLPNGQVLIAGGFTGVVSIVDRHRGYGRCAPLSHCHAVAEWIGTRCRRGDRVQLR